MADRDAVLPREDRDGPALEALRRTVEALEERVGMLETRPVVTARSTVGEATTTEALEALREELDAAKAGGAADDQEVQRLVDERVKELTGQATALAALQGSDFAGTLDDRMIELSRYLSLDDLQVDRVRQILVDQSRKEGEVMRLWAQGQSPTALEEVRRNNDRDMKYDLEAALNGEQVDRLHALYGAGN